MVLLYSALRVEALVCCALTARSTSCQACRATERPVERANQTLADVRLWACQADEGNVLCEDGGWGRGSKGRAAFRTWPRSPLHTPCGPQCGRHAWSRSAVCADRCSWQAAVGDTSRW